MADPIASKKGKAARVPFAQRRWPTYLYMGVLTLVFISLFQRIKDEHVSLGGDNADYFVLAKSLATGQGFCDVSNISAPPHNHFPPGYPFLMAGMMKLGITEITTLTWMNGLFLWAALMLLFVVFKRWSGSRELAAVAVLVCMMNAHLLGYSTIMMSEVPFLLCMAVTLFAYGSVLDAGPGRRRIAWVALLIASSILMLYIRTAGLAVVGALGAHLLLTKRIKLAFLFVGVVLLSQVPWQLRSRALGGSSYVRQLLSVNPYRPEKGTMQPSDWTHRVLSNAQRYFFREVPGALMPWTGKPSAFKIQRTKEWPLAASIVVAVCAGAWATGRYRWLVLLLLALNMSMLLLWPQVWVGPRFILPLIPLLMFLALLGLYAGAVWCVRRFRLPKAVAWVPVVPVVFVLMSFSNSCVLLEGRDYDQKKLNELSKERIVRVDPRAKRVYAPCVRSLAADRMNAYPERFEEYIRIAKWASEHTPRDTTTVVCCRKPALFYLFSGRYVTGFAKTADPGEMAADLEQRRVSYVVFDQLGFADVRRYLGPLLQRDPSKFKLLHSIPSRSNAKQITYLFSFDPRFGYHGPWKDGLKNGEGRLLGRDGSEFTGTWRNDTIMGQGTLRRTDGVLVVGEWTNGKLNGHGRYIKDGQVLQEGEFRNGVLIGAPAAARPTP